MNALSKHVYLFLVGKIPKSMRMLHKTECNKNDGFTLIKRILTLERESLHTPLEVLNKRERDTTIEKLNDWNTFEPDFVDLMDAFDEAESQKKLRCSAVIQPMGGGGSRTYIPTFLARKTS